VKQDSQFEENSIRWLVSQLHLNALYLLIQPQESPLSSFNWKRRTRFRATTFRRLALHTPLAPFPGRPFRADNFLLMVDHQDDRDLMRSHVIPIRYNYKQDKFLQAAITVQFHVIKEFCFGENHFTTSPVNYGHIGSRYALVIAN
jgi:hypothetical protein